MLDDESPSVRLRISWTLEKICEFHYDALIESTDYILINNFIKKMIESLNLENPKTNKKIITHICESFEILIINEFKYYKNKNDSEKFEKSILSPYYNEIFTKLLNIAFTKKSNDKEYNLSYASYSTMIALINYAPEDCSLFIDDFFPNFINALNSTFVKENYSYDEDRIAQQDNICSLLSTTIGYSKVNINTDKAIYLWEIVKSIFMERKNVFEEGLMVCSSLAIVLQKEFNLILCDYLEFLNIGLLNIENAPLCRMSINSLSNLIGSVGYGLEKWIDVLFNSVMNIMNVNFLFFLNKINFL